MADPSLDAGADEPAELVIPPRLGRGITRALGRLGPVPFGQVFTPTLLSAAPSPMHDDLNAWHAQAATRPPGRLDAFAAPRGHGKSTAGVEVGALWQVAYCHRRYVVIASDTWTQAAKRLETIVQEVENNHELRLAFPQLRPRRDAQGGLVAWRDDEAAFACGCRIIAVGAGKSIRGAKAGATRPDLLLLDDLEDEASVATEKALAARERWINRTALALAGMTTDGQAAGIDALWVGTILSRAALLNQATGAALEEGQTRSPAWRAWSPHVYRAEVQGSTPILTHTTVEVEGEQVDVEGYVGEPMWAGVVTREQLLGIRYRVGDDAYGSEYLADPADVGAGFLSAPILARYLNPDAAPLARIVVCPDGTMVPVATMVRAAALDPQYGDEASKDPDLGAIAVVGQAGARTFVLDAWIGRDRHGQAARLVNMATTWSCYAGAVESVAAQVVTADQAAALARLPIVPMPATKGKTTRALGLSVRMGGGRVFALPGGQVHELGPYLERFPNGRYDDPVDAVVMATDLATRVASAESVGAPIIGGSRAT